MRRCAGILLVCAVLAAAVAWGLDDRPWSRAPVQIAGPSATPEAQEFCPGLLERLPEELIGDHPRPVESAAPFAVAWGAGPVTLVCGAAAADPPSDRPLIGMNGVLWTVDLADPAVSVWTTVDRQVPVEITVPAETNGAAAIALTSIIRLTVPAST